MPGVDSDPLRPPESSEDELEASAAVHSDEPSVSTTCPPPKRKREPSAAARKSKRKKLEDKPDLPAVPATPQGHNQQSSWREFEGFSQQSGSQPKRRPGYKDRHRSKAAPEPSTGMTSRARTTGLDFSDVKEREASPPRKAKAFDTDDRFLDQAEELPDSGRALAPVPEVEDMFSSASTSATTLQRFESTPEPDHPQAMELFSSPPTSPEILDIDDIQEEALQHEAESATVICPVCHKEVDRTSDPIAKKAPRLLPMKKQQEFCRRHRSHEAESVRKERNYPMIDWQVLSLERIPAQVPHLRQVLRRETKCYYLDQLEENVTNAKGNRKAIRAYLTVRVPDIAKAGYYGPKGTGIMMDSVTSELSKDLTKMLSDKLLRSVGMGGYVAAVLVPELTLRLVMDDMNIHDEAAARKVLDDSTESGLLLNPDDDHIDRHVID